MDRRTFLKRSLLGVAAAGLAPLLRLSPAQAQAPAARYRLDEHYIGTFGPDGSAYGRSASGHELVRWAPGGEVQWQVGKLGDGPGEFNLLRDMALDHGGRYLYVADAGNHRVQIFGTDGKLLSQFGAAGEADGQFRVPSGIAISEAGYVYVTDRLNHRVQVFDAEGRFVGGFGSAGHAPGALNGPRGIALHPDSSIHVVDTANHRVQAYMPSGNFVGYYGEYGRDLGMFLVPTEIAIDAAGRRYVADPASGYVTVFGPHTEEDRFHVDFADARPAAPLHICLDPHGVLYVTGIEHHRG